MNKCSVLTQFQAQLILSLFPAGSQLLEANYFRNEYLPCPIRVTVHLPDDTLQVVVLRLIRHHEGSLHREAKLLPVLAAAGLPVPKVLVEPTTDPGAPGAHMVAVYSLLPGRNCQKLAEESTKGSEQAIKLVLQAVDMLAQMTETVQRNTQSDLLPAVRLIDELNLFLEQGEAWLLDRRVLRAIDRLQPVVEQVVDHLVFTNGDHQPANFLTDGCSVTGIVDFEFAHYQDFLLGFAKYPIYDLHPLNKAGMIPCLLKRKDVSRWDFAIRIAIGCLKTLQREIPVHGGDSEYRNHVLNLLEQAMATVEVEGSV